MALLPIVALASLFYVQMSTRLEQARDQELAQAARACAEVLKARLVAAQREVSAAATASAGSSLQGVLADEADSEFQAVAIINATGRRLDTRGDTGDLRKLDPETLQELDAGHAVLRLHEGRPSRVAVLHALRAGPLERNYLAAVIDPRYLAGDPRHDPMQVDFCVLSAGQVVAGCSGSGQGLPRAPLLDNALHGRNQAVRWREGDDYYRSSALTLSLEPALAGPNWTVIATQPESYALAPARSTGARFLWITVIVAALVLALAVDQVRRFVEPLRRLVVAIRRITQQDFSAKIPVDGRDEFAQLGRACKEMARGLRMNFATMNVLSQIDRTILTKLDVGRPARSALHYLRHITSVDLVILGLLEGDDEKTMRLHVVRAHGHSQLDGTVVQLPAEIRRCLERVPDGNRIANPLPTEIQVRLHREDGVKHFWVQPIARGERIWSVVVLAHSAPPSLSAIQLASLLAVADRLEVVFATVERDRKLHTMAHVDALTGLPNRSALLTLLSQELARAHRNRSCVGVLFLDLDRFKETNDTLGHAVGDTLLRRVAECIRRNVREDDSVARLGGDEFTIVLGSLTSARDASSVARQLIKALSRPFEVDGHLIHVGASAGISIYPDDGTEGDDLLKKADTAMYRAKGEGRNRFAFYEESMNVEARRRATLDRELRHALSHDEFVLHYQPQIDLRTGRVCVVEALVRWRHPKRGLLYPDAFIAFAEDAGLIPDIGAWVMREACLQHQRWRAAGVPIPRVSVNVSTEQLRRPNFVRTVLYLLNLAQMPSGSIEIEVTESMFLEGGKAALDALHTLVEAGVNVAIDDFGTGYSSFGYLKTLPASVLKLDKSFLTDATADNDAGTIIAAMINMAHTLRKEVVAEGVEREGQLEFLRELGCEKVQGYLFSRPVPPNEIARYAVERKESCATPEGASMASTLDDGAQSRRDIRLDPGVQSGSSSSEQHADGACALSVDDPAPVGPAVPQPGLVPGDRQPVRDGGVEEVVLDDDLLEEYVIDPTAVNEGLWRVLWSAPAPTDDRATGEAASKSSPSKAPVLALDSLQDRSGNPRNGLTVCNSGLEDSRSIPSVESSVQALVRSR
ncbi:MAG TPA: EAL domain-containing protein [Burkholderiaceae bacterium]|nr:EAL domain-containing protein [Burkholderiaceae bacterium]